MQQPKGDCGLANHDEHNVNSAYGATANKGFRFFDTRIAEGITLSGQLIIQNTAQTTNAYFSKILGVERDYSTYSDTDSAILDMEDFVEKFCPGKPFSEQLDFMQKVCDGKLQTFMNDECDKLSKSMNWNLGRIVFKRENLISRMLLLAPKMYCMLVHDSEGVRYAEPELKTKGVALVRSSTPNCVKPALRNCIMQILTGSEKEMQEYVKQQEQEYKKLTVETIAFPRSANNLAKYSSQDTIYGPKTPIAVRASLLYNKRLADLKLQHYETVSEGAKMKFVYLKEPNTLREDVIGFIGKLPPEFDLHRYADYDTMWEKSFIEPLKKLTDAAGWKVEEENTLDALFG